MNALDSPNKGQSARRAWPPVALLAALGGLLAWLGTSPRLLVFLNWDAGVYLATIGRGGYGFDGTPWNCHFGVGHLYIVFAALARWLGATPMQGFRLLNALAFALTAAVVADAALRLAGSRLRAALLTTAWLASYPTLLVLFTVEDNALFFPPASAILWLGLVRLENWGWKESLAAGVLAGAAVLMSWQAALYLAPPLYCALLLARPARRLPERLRDAAVLLGAFFATLVGWALIVAVPARELGVGLLLRILFSRPDPSLFPASLAEAVSMLKGSAGMLAALGIAVHRTLLPGFALPATGVQIALGADALALVLAVLADSFRRLRSPEGRRAHLFAATLALFVVLTSYYQTAQPDNVKRYDFLPLVLVFLVLGHSSGAAILRRRLAPVALAGLVLWQVVGGAHWWHVTLRDPPPLDPNWVQGEFVAPARVEGQQMSWYERLTRARQAKPHACRYVFTEPELENGRWWSEIPGLLWSEMRDTHVVLASERERLGWKRPPRFASVDELRADPQLHQCAWLSPAAAQVLAPSAPQRPAEAAHRHGK